MQRTAQQPPIGEGPEPPLGAAAPIRLKAGLTPALLPVACLIAALYLFFARLAFSGAVPFYRDAGRLYYPARWFMKESFARGELPAWFPYEALGVPFIGQVVTGVYHPLNLLYALLPFDLAFAWNHLLAYALALFGAYGFARRQALRPAAAAVAAIAYAFTGHLVSMTSNLPYLLGASSAPIWMWALDAALERATPARIGLAGAALSLAVLGGDPQGAMVQGLLGIAWAVFRGAETKRASRGAGIAAAACAAGVLLAAAQILPAVPAFGDSARAGGVSAEEAAKFAFHPARMVELVLPVAPAPGAPFADAVYAGLAATLLSLLGAWKAGARPRFWLGASAVFLWLSFGPSAGLDAALRWGMPLWSTFRYSEKMLPYAALGLALAASHGAAALPARLVRLAPLIVFADLYLRNEGAVRLASPRLLDAEPAAVAALREVEGPDFARRFRIATYYGARPPPAIADGRLTPDEALMRATAEALAPDLNALHGIATLNNYLPATPKWLLDAVRDPRFFARAGRYGVRWIVAYEDPPGVNPLQRVPLPTGATLLRIEDAPREEPAPGGARNAVRAARGGLALSALAALALLALSMAEKRHRLRSQ